MVVSEGGGMLSGNQYLQPDYLTTMPPQLDAKKCPLALLAQTCSQIGADSPSSKSLLSPLEKQKKSITTSDTRSSPSSIKDKSEKSVQRSSPENKLAFKPYEMNVLSKKSDDSRPSSKPSGSQSSSVNEERKSEQNSDRKSASPSKNPSTPSPEGGKTSPVSDNKSSTPSARGASPIIRSGMEVLQGHPKDSPLGSYKASALSSAIGGGLGGHLSSLCCPPGLDHTNPAFRPPYPGTFSPHHPMLAAGYPSASAGPYLSYARVKTPAGESLVPVCKDPYCGCQLSINNQHLLVNGASGPCPSGCTQCDHQKYNLMAMSLLPPGPVPTSLAYPHLGRHYVCNWVVGDTYCGKRFVTSDELLQHLRTHTSATDAASAAVTSTASSLLSPHPLFSTAALHRPGYPTPSLSPLSSRYHPYAKLSPPQTTLAASPYSAFNPTLGPYYSPYSMYGQRLGAAAVHP